MKTSRTLLAALLVSAATAPAAMADWADSIFARPYVGLDYQFTDVKWKSGNDNLFDKNFNGGDLHIGSRFGKYWGLELGYFDSFRSDKDNVLGTGVDNKTRLMGGTLDLLGYLPISSLAGQGSMLHGLDLIGSVGVAVENADNESTGGVDDFSKTDWRARLGLGGQYWLTPTTNIRVMENWQDMDFGGRADDAWITRAGLNFAF